MKTNRGQFIEKNCLAGACLGYCSEEFAELMFSKVTDKPEKATAISSVYKENSTCKYPVELS